MFLSVTATAIKNMPAATINSIPTTYFTSATASQAAALKSSPYYSSFSDTIKNSIASASGTTYTGSSTSSSTQIYCKKASIALSSLIALIFFIAN